MEAFARALPHWRKVQGLDWPAGYVQKAVVNVARTRARRRKLESVLSWTAPTENPASGTVDTRLTLAPTLMRLPMAQRTVLVLRYYMDMTEFEVADLLDLPLGTVKSRISRAKETIRKSLRERED